MIRVGHIPSRTICRDKAIIQNIVNLEGIRIYGSECIEIEIGNDSDGTRCRQAICISSRPEGYETKLQPFLVRGNQW